MCFSFCADRPLHRALPRARAVCGRVPCYPGGGIALYLKRLLYVYSLDFSGFVQCEKFRVVAFVTAAVWCVLRRWARKGKG